MKKVTIDPGHAPGNANKGPTGYFEFAGMWKLSNYLKDALIRCGIDAKLTRTENEDPSLSDRGNRARGSDVFISEHSNAANGQARGVECFYSVRIPGDKIWAGKLSAAVAKLMGNNDRGAKTRESETAKGYDYYGVIRSAVAAGVPHVFLAESGFHDNALDEAFLKVDSNLKLIAEAQAKVLCELLGVTYVTEGMANYYIVQQGDTLSRIAARFGVSLDYLVEINSIDNPSLIHPGQKIMLIKIEENKPVPDTTSGLTPIMGNPVATKEQARAWLQQVAPDWVLMADLFYSIAPKYNIRPDVALAQVCKETGYFRFGGLVKPWQNNFAGIAATGQASDGNTPLRGADPQKVRFEKDIHGAIFADRATGVEAQIQHLYAYATKEALPQGVILYSPRFTLVQRGTAPYVEHLGAGENPAGVGWAYPGKDYGQSIVKDYLNKLYAIKIQEPALPEEKPNDEINALKTENTNLKARVKYLEEIIISIGMFTQTKIKEGNING